MFVICSGHEASFPGGSQVGGSQDSQVVTQDSQLSNVPANDGAGFVFNFG